jgi:hypothetical protein
MVWLRAEMDDQDKSCKTSNITDHANSEPHKTAVMYLRKDQAKSRNEPVASYSPIACSFLSSSMDPAVRERIKKKFDIGFVLAKEHIPWKYPAIQELGEAWTRSWGNIQESRFCPKFHSLYC